MINNKKLLLIDGSSLMFRAFYALHSQLDKFINNNGLHTNAIYTFKNMLDVLLSKFCPTNILVAFDAGRVTFRTKEFSNYKANRLNMPKELSEQIPYIYELLKDYGISIYKLDNYEADDIIGTLSNKANKANIKTIIVTGDKDILQMVSDNTFVALTVKGVNDLEIYTPNYLKNKLGINANQIPDMKGLMGDTSDNYPGVTKVGEKTALRLISKYGSINNIYENIDLMKKSKLKEHLIKDKKQAFLCKKLATIDKDVPIDITLENTKYYGANLKKLISFYKKMDFYSFLNKDLKKLSALNVEKKLSYIELNEQNMEIIKNIKSNVVFIIESIGNDYHTDDLIGFVIGDGNNWIVSDNVNLLKNEYIKALMLDKNIEKWVFNAKKEYFIFHRIGIDVYNVTFDLLLSTYLLNPNNNIDDIASVAALYNDFSVKSDKSIYGNVNKINIPDKDTLYNHLINKASIIYKLHDTVINELCDHEQMNLFKNIELPISKILSNMEINGIVLDVSKLKKMGQSFQKDIDEITDCIYNEAGEKFNINSPKQLGNILFNKLKLPYGKKTKIGYSTSEKVLSKLTSNYPIATNILNYREMSKLKSTYVDGLLKCLQSDNKIHTHFLQTLTQTGRLSSVNPNMQNIPARDKGKDIRKAFIPSKNNYLLSFDYSQIELRVLAHISNDKNMINAFLNNEDIHTHTAMTIFNLDSPDQVTSDMRRKAKATNFGIVYGISDYGLSQSINIPLKEAHNFIELYFQHYPNVKKYMQNIVQKAKEQGYVKTLFNRRRYLPNINSNNYNLRSFSERMAMNTPIQGSAADIIKIAMRNISNEIYKENLKAKMLLQVHDELIFDVPKLEIEYIIKIITKLMDSAVKLKVPLKVDVNYGNTWFDLK